MTESVASLLAATRERLLARGAHGSGLAWQASWTRAVDRAVHEAYGAAAVPTGVAVVALGGYGRSELAPRSDIDVLVVHAGRPGLRLAGSHRVSLEQLAELVRAIADPLWSLSLVVGHTVRSLEEAVEQVDDVQSVTAMLDARFVAGNPVVAASLSTELRRRVRADHLGLLAGLLAEDRQRHGRYGMSADLLEPHLKNGAGGLRDVQSLRWAAMALAPSPAPRTLMEGLVSSGYLAAADLPRLTQAQDQLQSARVALHLAGGNDVLRLDDHERFAQVIRERIVTSDPIRTDDAAPVPLEELHARLRQVMLAMRTVEHAHRRAWALIAADLEHGLRRLTRSSARRIDDFAVADGVLTIATSDDTRGERAVLADETFALRLLSVLIDHQVVIDRRTAAAIRNAAEQTPTRWSWHVDARRAALDALWAGRSVVAALAEIDDAGVLGCLMPEWEPLRGRAQRNPYHQFTLDRHAWHAVEQLGRIVEEETWARAAVDRVDDRDGLLVAVMLHDVGKAVGEPHAETGVEPARVLAARMGTSRPTVEMVGRLTRWHLLLADTARRRDIADPGVVADVARIVKDRAMLAALHLLTAADGRATSPSAWNPWIAGLVAQLVDRVDAVLDGRSADDTPTGPIATTEAAFDRAEKVQMPAGVVRGHVAAMPGRYPAAVGPDDIVEHATRAIAVRDRRGSVRVRHANVGDASAHGPCRLDVVGFDRSGMFATAVKVITAQGGDIHAADLFAANDGITVLTIDASAPDDADPEWPARVSEYLESGRDVPRRRGSARLRMTGRAVDEAAAVEVRRASEGDLIKIEINAADTPGLLLKLLAVLDQWQLDPVMVRATSQGTRASDVLTVRSTTSTPVAFAALHHALRAAADDRDGIAERDRA